ncbi:MAG: hypothetical protein M3Q44_05025 [bacterium]|nr:hypothetical protein [bacterium]
MMVVETSELYANRTPSGGYPYADQARVIVRWDGFTPEVSGAHVVLHDLTLVRAHGSRNWEAQYVKHNPHYDQQSGRLTDHYSQRQVDGKFMFAPKDASVHIPELGEIETILRAATEAQK